MKKSFIFYGNWAAMIAKLPDEVAGKLIKMICQYEFSGEEVEGDPILNAIFASIKPSLDMNTEKYQKKVERVKDAREKRSRSDINMKSERNQSEISLKSERNQSEIVGDTDTVTDTVTVLSKDNIKDNVGKPDTFDSDIKTIVDYLNAKTQSNFKAKTEETRKSIRARLKEGYTVEDFKRVIDSKSSDWADSERMREYLRPSTLFRPANFEAYLNEANRPKVKKKSEFFQNEYDFDELERQLMKN